MKKMIYNYLKKKYFPDYDTRLTEFAADWRDRLLAKRAGFAKALKSGAFRLNHKKLNRLQGATNVIEEIINQLDISLKKEGL